MIMTLEQLRAMFSNNVSRARSIERIISTPRFQEAWTNSDETARLTVQNIVGWLDVDRLEDWLKRHEKRLEYAELSTTRLKQIARKQGIPYYGSKTKAQLLSELIPEDEYEEARDARLHESAPSPDGADDC